MLVTSFLQKKYFTVIIFKDFYLAYIEFVVHALHKQIIDFTERRATRVSSPIRPVFTCSKLTIETLEQGVEYVQS